MESSEWIQRIKDCSLFEFTREFDSTVYEYRRHESVWGWFDIRLEWDADSGEYGEQVQYSRTAPLPPYALAGSGKCSAEEFVKRYIPDPPFRYQAFMGWDRKPAELRGQKATGTFKVARNLVRYWIHGRDVWLQSRNYFHEKAWIKLTNYLYLLEHFNDDQCGDILSEYLWRRERFRMKHKPDELAQLAFMKLAVYVRKDAGMNEVFISLPRLWSRVRRSGDED